MKKLPKELRQKLKRFYELNSKSKNLELQILDTIQEYGLDIHLFDATIDEGNEFQTEALTFLSYGEGDVDEIIKEFEEVFLYHVNRK